MVKGKALYRGTDYEIDYDRGTILFRSPILATELNPFAATLVNRIVVTYQNEAGEDSQLYGGRLQLNLRNGNANPDKTAFLGGSYLKEEQGVQDFELYGVYFYAPFASGFILGEYARSQHNIINFGDVSGSAYRLDTLVEHKFSEDTNISARYSILWGIDGMNDQSSIGLNQGIRLAPGLKLDLGYSLVFKDIFSSTATGIRFA